jgi:light-regulated signal transduction histidine kinase (bacteriophytochrome)
VAGHTLRLRTVPLELGDGRRGGMALAIDITDLRRTERSLHEHAVQLERSNRELEHFAHIASHDLQEPLRKIQAFGERLATRYAPALDKRGIDFVERMAAAASRMSQLIDDLLTYSRVSTQPRPFAPVDVGAVVADVVSDLEPRIRASGACVEVGPLPTLDADAVLLRQLFQNLVANALKFCRPDVAPRVEIALVDAAAAEVTMAVADNGIGFDDRYAERMFGMFERLNGRSEFEGSGIGLAVCRRIVERHGGRISAHGKPGEGARFTVTLPRVQRESGLDARAADGALA